MFLHHYLLVLNLVQYCTTKRACVVRTQACKNIQCIDLQFCSTPPPDWGFRGTVSGWETLRRYQCIIGGERRLKCIIPYFSPQLHRLTNRQEKFSFVKISLKCENQTYSKTFHFAILQTKYHIMKLNLKICQFFILKTNLYANHSAHRIYLQPKTRPLSMRSGYSENVISI